jgi:hypothetical protein
VIEIIIDFRWWNGPVLLPPEARGCCTKGKERGMAEMQPIC